MDLMLALAQISVTKIAVPRPRYIQKIIDKFVRYLLHKCNNLLVFFIGRIYVHLQSVKTYPYP